MVRAGRTHDRVTVDDTWRLAVKAELIQRGWKQKDLAAKVPCSAGAITNLLTLGRKAKQGVKQSRQSRLVLRIEEILGWESTHGPAIALPRDDKLRRFKRMWPDLTDGDQDHVLALIERLASKR